MKTLTALLLLLSLVLPAGLVSQVMAAPAPPLCGVVDESGSACCDLEVTHCCCNVSPVKPASPVQPLPEPAPSSATKNIAASLPNLLILAELPRLSEFSAKPALPCDLASFLTAPAVRLCVLRCSLLL